MGGLLSTTVLFSLVNIFFRLATVIMSNNNLILHVCNVNDFIPVC